MRKRYCVSAPSSEFTYGYGQCKRCFADCGAACFVVGGSTYCCAVCAYREDDEPPCGCRREEDDHGALRREREATQTAVLEKLRSGRRS
jgi:hypothetical protein